MRHLPQIFPVFLVRNSPPFWEFVGKSEIAIGVDVVRHGIYFGSLRSQRLVSI